MKTRNREIDIMKGLLTVAMILCHCIQFFGNEGVGTQKQLVNLINLTTFSGFLFCFGYVSELAYYRKDFKTAAWKMGKNAVRMVIAFYISGLGYIALAERKTYQWQRVEAVLKLRVFPGWSEFLASFAAVLLIGIVLYPLMKRMNWKLFLAFLAASLAGCWLIPYGEIHNSYLALLVGSNDYTTFPVLQYGVFFAAGVWFSKEKISWEKKTLLGAILFGIPFFLYYAQHDSWLPGRFPPSVCFICGGIFGVYVYRLVSLLLAWLAEKNTIADIVMTSIENIGMNSMFYLILSNLLIFAVAGSNFTYRSIKFAYWYFGIVLCIIYFLRKYIRTK